MAIRDHHAKILEARGLDIELLEHLGVTSSPRGGFDIKIPYIEAGQEVNAKFRTITGDKRFMQETGRRKVFWNVDVISDETLAGQPIIITEGEFDAMAALQAGFGRVVSVPDGAPATEIGKNESSKYTFLDNAPKALWDAGEIILCTDSDMPGINLLNDLALRLGRARCKWVRYPKGCKDLNDALATYGLRGVTETIARAQWLSVEGVYRMSELPPLVEAVPRPIGIVGLEDRYKARLGDLVVVTGIPSHGKTVFIGDVVCHLCREHGWGVAFASFEQQPQTDHRRNLRTWFNGNWVNNQTAIEIAEADAWIDENFVFIVPSEDEDTTLAWLLERASAAVVRYGVKVLVVDPWNEMDHLRPGDMSQTEYVGYAIKQLKKFAAKHRIHLIVAAHPAKMVRQKDGSYPVPTLYDVSDSAHWYNKPELGIVIWRDPDGTTLVRIAKSRHPDLIGEPGDVNLRFDRSRACYRPLDDGSAK